MNNQKNEQSRKSVIEKMNNQVKEKNSRQENEQSKKLAIKEMNNQKNSQSKNGR